MIKYRWKAEKELLGVSPTWQNAKNKEFIIGQVYSNSFDIARIDLAGRRIPQEGFVNAYGVFAEYMEVIKQNKTCK